MRAHMDQELHAIADAQHGDALRLHVVYEAGGQLRGICDVHRVGAAGQDDGLCLGRLDPFLPQARAGLVKYRARPMLAEIVVLQMRWT